MSFYALILLAFSMSMDAFAVSIAKGAGRSMAVKKVISTALVFGLVEACTPLIGWLFGSLAKQFISEWDHWLAFILLGVLGLKMIKEGLADGDDEDVSEFDDAKTNWGLTILTAIATSIDSMVVGVGLAFMNVNIIIASLTIGLATTCMTFIGMSMGKVLGKVVGKRAEIFGGVVLLTIGSLTLMSHLNR